MTGATRQLLVTLVLLALSPPALAQMNDEIGISRGSPAPDVTVEDLEGNPVALGPYLGERPLLLEFWATWCENCRELLPTMLEAYQRYSDRVQFFAIGVGVGQSPRTIKRHLERHPAPYPHLFDARGRAVRAYQVPTTSYVVIIDSDGTVVYTGVGGDQDLIEALQEVVGR